MNHFNPKFVSFDTACKNGLFYLNPFCMQDTDDIIQGNRCSIELICCGTVQSSSEQQQIIPHDSFFAETSFVFVQTRRLKKN